MSTSMMIDIAEVKTVSPEYTYIEEIMTQAFPVDERPDCDALRLRVDTNPRLHCCVLRASQTGRPIGLLTYWLLDGILYVEHFAVDPALRGRGYGNTALLCLINKHQLPTVLEVEPPTTYDARRRIAFYERAGLVLWPDAGYMQPAYRPGGNDVHMRLMATPDLSPDRYEEVKRSLYRDVYGK